MQTPIKERPITKSMSLLKRQAVSLAQSSVLGTCVAEMVPDMFDEIGV